MILSLGLCLLMGSPASSLRAKDVFYASEDRLKKVVGRRTSYPNEVGVTFAHPGFTRVWVDQVGPKMRHTRFTLVKLYGWRQFLTDLGLNAKYAVARQSTTDSSPTPLYRNKMIITGVSGQPSSAAHKPWSVIYLEFAVANRGRIDKLRSQIKALPVGPERLRLIRSCYDWVSELDIGGE